LFAAVAPAASEPAFQIDSQVGLTSLISISDGQLSRMADTLQAIADTPEAARGDWAALKTALGLASTVNVPAAIFYARRDGTCFRLTGSAEPVTIRDRDYFTKVMSGAVSIGDLVVSRTTNRNVTIVAVPVRNGSGSVVSLIGASIFLDDLSAIVKSKMGIAHPLVFWAIDRTGKIALHSDPSNIFVEPGKMTGALARVRDEMLAHDSGSIAYEYRGAMRTVIYRKSSLSGWRYGFGVVR
jgi:methyl-accepting chemotaxis protein